MKSSNNNQVEGIEKYSGVETADEIVVACCVCHSIKWDSDKWIDFGENAYKLIDKNILSHGYCPSCAEEAFRQMREYNLLHAKP